MSRLHELFGFLVKVLNVPRHEAAAQLPGAGKWRRMQHPAKCRCVPETMLGCSDREHELGWCKRHRCYVCGKCGRTDRRPQGGTRIGNGFRIARVNRDANQGAVTGAPGPQ